MTEVWATIPGWEGYYEVSSHGRVRGVERRVPHHYGTRLVKQRVVAQQLNTCGYPTVRLQRSCRKGDLRWYAVHSLVLQVFVGPKPEGMEACHANDIKTDNRLENLRWDVRQQNMVDRGENNRHYYKLSPEQVLEMRRLWKEGGRTFAELAKQFGCARVSAARAIKGKTYAWLK